MLLLKYSIFLAARGECSVCVSINLTKRQENCLYVQNAKMVSLEGFC